MQSVIRMDIRSLVEILLPLLVLLASSQIAHGFATPKCKTDEFVGGIREMAQCDDPHVINYVEKMLKLYDDALKSNSKVLDLVEACKIHNDIMGKAEHCTIDFVKKCMDEKINTIAAKAFPATELTCDDPSMPLNITKIMEYGQMVEQTLGMDPIEYAMNLITFDKTCTGDKQFEAIEKENMPCMGGQFATLLPLMEYFMGEMETGKQVPKDQFPAHISVCTKVKEILDTCFNENTCFSEGEMHLGRDVMATFYKRVLEILIKIEKIFGSFEKFINAMEKFDTIKLMWHTTDVMKIGEREINLRSANQQDEMIMRMSKVVKHLIDDYKSSGCQKVKPELARMSMIKSDETSDDSATTAPPSSSATTPKFEHMFAIVLVALNVMSN